MSSPSLPSSQDNVSPSELAEPFAKGWLDLRRRRKANYGLLGGFVFFGALAALFKDTINSTFLQYLIAAFLAVWLAFAASIFWLSWWRCPRCRQDFFSSLLPRFACRRCGRCGLPKFALRSPLPFLSAGGSLTFEAGRRRQRISLDAIAAWGLAQFLDDTAARSFAQLIRESGLRKPPPLQGAEEFLLWERGVARLQMAVLDSKGRRRQLGLTVDLADQASRGAVEQLHAALEATFVGAGSPEAVKEALGFTDFIPIPRRVRLLLLGVALVAMLVLSYVLGPKG